MSYKQKGPGLVDYKKIKYLIQFTYFVIKISNMYYHIYKNCIIYFIFPSSLVETKCLRIILATNDQILTLSHHAWVNIFKLLHSATHFPYNNGKVGLILRLVKTKVNVLLFYSLKVQVQSAIICC